MKPITKTVRRTVTIRSSDRAISDAEWILEIGPSGIGIRRFGEKHRPYFLSWRSIIGHALIHRAMPKSTES